MKKIKNRVAQHDPDGVKVNQYAKCLGKKLMPGSTDARTHTHKHTHRERERTDCSNKTILVVGKCVHAVTHLEQASVTTTGHGSGAFRTVTWLCRRRCLLD